MLKKFTLLTLGLICMLVAAPLGFWAYIFTGNESMGPAYGIFAGSAAALAGLFLFVKGSLIGSNNNRRTLAHIALGFWLLGSTIAFLVTSSRLVLGRSNLTVEPIETYVFLAAAILGNVLLWIWLNVIRKK